MRTIRREFRRNAHVVLISWEGHLLNIGAVNSRNKDVSVVGKNNMLIIRGNGNRAGRNAFSAIRSMTIESFPPEKSKTGRSNSAATSRMMWIDSDSSSSRWLTRG